MSCVEEVGPGTAEKIQDFIRGKVSESGSDGVVIGLSGGVDSSTVACLAVNALGPERVLGILMPSATTPPEDTEHASLLAEKLGIETETIEIDPITDAFNDLCGHQTTGMAAANLKPRARMMVLYYHANSLNLLVAGTGNRTELLVGYFTKYGDGGVDMLPIGCLYKKQVRMLAEGLGVPPEIIDKAPTAGLWPGQTDEGELGIEYDVLDEILCLLVDHGYSTDEITSRLGIDAGEVERIGRMVEAARHKLMPPEIPKLR
ncbi:NAD+ synthase [Methanothermobacter wolfeii]|uniref:NAD+ synthase n=1 Tax=Methanothermobacter wolfeii TaxID=145261 RepID=UPI0024B34478|nr:NAD+ synthase [Methanothermobacter wolfeii]MDI6701808.1 NAD+ synthase [Methanothermobacter wolfeii]MDI6841253.1 NAD+ synthase [Methanothermobacter wolfeii]